MRCEATDSHFYVLSLGFVYDLLLFNTCDLPFGRKTVNIMGCVKEQSHWEVYCDLWEAGSLGV